MASSNGVVQVVFVAAVLVLFLEPLTQAIDSLEIDGLSYASELTLILDQLPLFVGLLAIVIVGVWAVNNA